MRTIILISALLITDAIRSQNGSQISDGVTDFLVYVFVFAFVADVIEFFANSNKK